MAYLIATQDFPPGFTGGIASWAEDMAEVLHRAGESVTVLARATEGTAAHDKERPYKVVRMVGRSWGRWQGLWTALAGLPHLRNPKELRVLFATWPLAAGLGPIASAAGAQVGVAFHGSDLTRTVVPTDNFRRAIASARDLFPVSNFLATELERLGVPRERVRVLPMPLALPSGSAPRGEGLLCVARLTPLKGVERAIGLARALRVPLTVVGEGPEAPRLSALARGQNVVFTGRLTRPEIAAIPAAAAVLLSRPDDDGTGAEGLGLTLLEAAARGLPAIGCRTGGVPEAVGPGVILDNPDSPTPGDLAAVRALLADAQAGEVARAWVRQHHGPGPVLAALDVSS